MLDKFELPSLEDHRVKSSITLFYKIHLGAISFDNEKYLTPAANLKRTRVRASQDIWPIEF